MRGRPTVLLLAICAVVAIPLAAEAGSVLAAQTPQQLDFMGFILPTGEWQMESGPGYQGFARAVPVRGFCRLTVYRATPSLGGLDSDAAADWDALIVRRYPGAANRKTRTVPIGGTAWTFTQQTAMANVDGTDMLLSVHTFTGHGQHMSLLFENTHQPFDDLINQVIGGLTMGAPAAPATASVGSNPSDSNPQGKPSSLIGKWQRTSSSFTHWGSGDSQGYTRWMYDFEADGSFTFASKTWPMGGDRMYYRRESGSYRLDGEGFTLTPRQSVSESWTKKQGQLNDPGQLISRQTNTLEAARYRFVYHYSSGIREWNLILMTDRETGRDGRFESNTLFPNGWFYKQVGAGATVE